MELEKLKTKKCDDCYVNQLLDKLYIQKIKEDKNLMLLDEKTKTIKFREFNLLLEN